MQRYWFSNNKKYMLSHAGKASLIRTNRAKNQLSSALPTGCLSSTSRWTRRCQSRSCLTKTLLSCTRSSPPSGSRSARSTSTSGRGGSTRTASTFCSTTTVRCQNIFWPRTQAAATRPCNAERFSFFDSICRPCFTRIWGISATSTHLTISRLY